MSDYRRPKTLPCPWWWLRGAFLLIYDQVEPRPARPAEHYLVGGWQAVIDIPDEQIGTYTSDITLTGDDKSTAIEISDPWHRLDAYWDVVLYKLERYAFDMHEGRRRHAPTADDVIQIYYRSRAAGGKVTLRQLAEQYGFNAKSLSNAKRAYDKRGGWGSKVHKENGHKSNE